MKKEYQIVSDFIKKNLIVTTMTLASIAFTLFDVKANEADSEVCYNEVEVVSVAERPSLDASNGKVVFMNNPSRSCITMMDEAFQCFLNKTPNGGQLSPIFECFRKELSSIDVEKVSINGNVEFKRLNIAFRLPHSYILSVTKFADSLQDDDFVAFNLFHERELLISDVIRINLLKGYISNVQERLSNGK